MKNNNKKMTIDKLARMVAKGFFGVEERMATKDDLKAMEKRIENRLVKLEDGQLDLKLKLDNVVYHYEFDELKKRVEKLEKV